VTIDALLSLGGNMGDRRAIMEAAIALLAALPGTSVTARSSFYRTEPDGPVVQDWFVNLAVAVRTEFDAASLAAACREIEAALGRDRSEEIPWGPRPIDIDVIAFGRGGIMQSWGGTLDTRRFVQIPLSHIASGVMIDGITVVHAAAEAEQIDVVRLDWPVPPVAG
jgi:2-amino-4-hydroxy-6-hydroxymethyldihydropteridine diphosphokinase